MSSDGYLIFCSERSPDGVACWWRPRKAGYTKDIDEAGVYTRVEAEDIERNSRGEDFGISREVIESMKLRRICYMNDGTNWQQFKRFGLKRP
jgi:hypothetical protein